MDMGLDGKGALVGGASKGIGKSIAIGLAREGCRVAVCARGREDLETTAKEISATGVGALPVVCDMASYDDIKRAVEEAAAGFERLEGASFQERRPATFVYGRGVVSPCGRSSWGRSGRSGRSPSTGSCRTTG